MTAVRFIERGVDVRELAAADLAKAGVEGFNKTLFPRGEVVEVKPEVAKALVEDGRFGQFEIVESTGEQLDIEPPVTDKKSAGK